MSNFYISQIIIIIIINLNKFLALIVFINFGFSSYNYIFLGFSPYGAKNLVFGS